jgi:micrococcal nuclease
MLSALLLSVVLASAPQTAHVVAVHDGDTITVRIDGRSEKVRLVGIDSPELDDERREYREAVILDDGTNVNEEFVRKGYAHVYDKFNFKLKPRFKEAEAAAKREKLGVWLLPPGPWREVPSTH